MITLGIVLLLALVLIIALLIAAGGFLAAFGWILLGFADMAIAIYIISKIFSKKK